jgi:hypothetical protein
MGYNIAGFKYPWTAVGYVAAAANVDAETYSNRAVDQVTVDAGGAVVAWAFVALGEFCDVDGVEGFQVRNGANADYIINYFLAPLATYTQTCGVTTEPQTGLPAYYSTITSVLNIFQTTCYVFENNTGTQNLFNGRQISNYDFKCNVRINYAGLWSTNASAVNGCPDTQRKIGLLLNVAGSAFDFEYKQGSALNRAGANTPDGNSLTFSGGKLRFRWDNYFVSPGTPGGVTGSKRAVVAAYLQAGDATYKGASAVESFIFSFAKPKSDPNDEYFWDPTINVNSVSSTVASFGLFLIVLLALL